MAQVSASTGSQSLAVWTDRAKLLGQWLAVAAVAFLIGAFIFAPARQRAQPTHMPASFLGLPTGIITLQAEEGANVLLPVRIADTSSSRQIGFREVGESSIDNQFLLYAQSRQMTSRTSYTLEGVRVPLDVAVIDSEGNVVNVLGSNAGQERLSIADPHRWLLTAKAGTFAHYGIAPGMKLDTESVRKINL